MAAPRPSHPPLRDSKSSLYEAAVAVVKSQEVEAEKARAALTAGRRRPWRLLFVGIGLAGLVLLLIRPVWLAGPRSLPKESPGIQAASLRLELLRQRQQVNDFVKRNGRLPATLEEAGGTSPNPAIHLERAAAAGAEFSLWGQVGDSLITLRSTDPLTEFLGSSLQVIRNRGRE